MMIGWIDAAAAAAALALSASADAPSRSAPVAEWPFGIDAGAWASESDKGASAAPATSVSSVTTVPGTKRVGGSSTVTTVPRPSPADREMPASSRCDRRPTT